MSTRTDVINAINGIRFSAVFGIFVFIISFLSPVVYRLAGGQKITNPNHKYLLGATAFFVVVTFVCSCAILYILEPGGNAKPDAYFIFLTCGNVVIDPTKAHIFNDDLCDSIIYPWIVVMIISSFLANVVGAFACKNTYTLWGSAFLSTATGVSRMAKLTLVGKKTFL